MPELTIDGKKTAAPAGFTILEAAAQLGIAIPTLCHHPDLKHFTSCMVCLVQDARSGRLVPACSRTVEDGMIIQTASPAALEARKASLDLLLSEHVGDCEAPCQRACPARLDIPAMIRQLAAGSRATALETARADLLLPAILGRICPAPCEKACRRGRHDQPLAIRLLERFTGDTDPAGGGAGPSTLPAAPSAAQPTLTGKKVAIVGAGPAGLSAAAFLARAGHSCTLFDEHDLPGGALRYSIPESTLPRRILDSEIALLLGQGIEFRPRCRMGTDLPAGRLQMEYDVVVVTTGQPPPPPDGPATRELADHLGLATREGFIETHASTLATRVPGIFAGGSAVQPSRLAVRAIAQGRLIAHSASQFLAGLPPAPPPRRFNSIMGRVRDEELAVFVRTVSGDPRLTPAGAPPAGFAPGEAVRESLRCLHCDCRKPDSCKLRDLSELCGASQARFRGEDRPSFDRITTHPHVIYEPGKCIKCGICVRLCEKERERFGLAFIGRGFQVHVAAPLEQPLSEALTRTAAACIAACPTGALASP